CSPRRCRASRQTSEGAAPEGARAEWIAAMVASDLRCACGGAGRASVAPMPDPGSGRGTSGFARCHRPVAPVPRLVDDAVRITARVAHRETVRACVSRQPREGVRVFERFFCRRLARGADVECLSAMVLAETGGSVDGEDRVDLQPAFALALE